MQSHVHDRLVERPSQERGVDAYHRSHARHREAGRESDRVLLADADVEEAVRELLGEIEQPGRRCHRRGDRAHLGPPGGCVHERFTENVCVGQVRGAGAPGQWIEGADSVELVDLVLHSRAIPVSLLGHHVHDHWPTEFLRAGEDGLELGLVVAVHNARVLDAQAFEHRRRLEKLLQAFLDAIRGLVGGRADEGQATEEARDLDLDALVAGIDTELRQVPSQAAHRGGVRAPVVVDDDDQVWRLQVRDLVERLVSHASGQRSIADDGDDMTGLLLAQPSLSDAERIAQRGGGMAVLDQVVLGLLARGVAGQSTCLAESREIFCPAGDDLVYICLVAGVPHDRVFGALEHPVQSESQLDDPEVGGEVAAAPGRLLDQERAHLLGKLRQLRLIEAPEVFGRADGLEDAHTWC